jgi:hypothetical protein
VVDVVRRLPRNRLLLALSGAALLLLRAAPAGAADAPVTFSVIADVPYEESELAVLAQHVTNHDRYSPADFFVHLGDIVGSSGPCVESAYQDVANVLLDLAVPAFIIPGDNEWNDCDEPEEAWDFWETYFTDFEGSFCGTPPVQGQLARPENFAFADRGVLFVGINLPGGSTPPGGWSPLLQHAAEWVGGQLAGQQAAVRAAVIFAHAGPGQSKHATFFDQFVPDAAAFAKPILYLHGDGHSWRMDRPFTAQNVLRVQLERGTKPPVEVTVGLDPVNPFALDRDPWPSGTPRFNKPPCVEAISDLSVDLGDVVSLDALVTDDGDPDPPGDVTTLWSQVSGPGPVTIASPAAIQTTAVFPDSGTFVLRLAANDGGLQTSDDVAVEVIGNDPLLTVDDVFVGEGQDAVFEVRLLAADGPATVSYGTADGSAVAPGDYSARSGTLSFSTTTTSRTVSVPVHVDGLVEGTESFFLNLSNPSGADLDDAQAVAVVLDADVPPPPEVSAFAPEDGAVGAQITLAGANFTGATQVRFNGTAAASFVVDSDSQIRAVVPSGATSGPLSVTAAGGTGASAASFEVRLPRLQVEVAGAGSVALSPTGGSYPLGSVVSLTAIPASGFQFVGWSGDLSGGASPATIVMDGDRSVNASFGELPPGFVSLDVALDGPGTVATSPAGRVHPVGTLVTLAATPASGHVFGEWSGDVSGAANPASLTLTGHGSVTATFLELAPGLASLDLAVSGPGSIVQSPAGRVQPIGTLVTLTALPNPGASLTGWSGDLTGSTNPATFALDTSRNVTATFGPPATGDVTFATVATGGATSAASVSTSTDVPGVANSLYLAAVATKNYVNTTSVSGLGLAWSELVDQCGGRSQTGVSLWWAQGAPGASGPVTAGLASAAGASSLVVARYTGTPLTSPLGEPPHVVSANTLGVSGLCSGGVDSASYAVPFSTLAPEALVFSAAARRQHAHTPGAGWTERAETMAGTGGSAVGIAVQDRAFPVAGPVTVAGSTASTTDWAVAAVEVRGSQLELPAIASFDPGAGPVGTVVTLAGQGFTGTTVVAFAGTPAEFVVDSDAQIRATVPVGAIGGPIRVVNPAGAAESATGYVVTGPPIVASFNPSEGPVGTELTIAGGRFADATGVAVAGTPASFVVDSDVQIRANVPAGATSGPIAVTNPLGTDISATTFTVIDPAVIDSFAPLSGPVGTLVTVSGSGFSAATSLTFGGTDASFVIDSDAQMTATVPAGAVTGPIAVTSPAGTAAGAGTFTVIDPAAVESFAPTSGRVGTEVVIAGAGFATASAVAFATTAASFVVDSDAQIRATVPAGAVTGPIVVTNAGGTGASATAFLVTVLACENGLDDDGDGTIDFGEDPGCDGPDDDSERSASLACDDGTDDDGDGLVDYPADPGCRDPAASREHAACQDGLDNDGDGRIDFDGGASLNGGTPIAPADTFCSAGFVDRERKNSCGLGFELALVLPLLAGLRRSLRPGR